jgi:hypothetical protein
MRGHLHIPSTSQDTAVLARFHAPAALRDAAIRRSATGGASIAVQSLDRNVVCHYARRVNVHYS